ncbi:hypothetical protein P3S67_013702 [Capsicum chacoense]
MTPLNEADSFALFTKVFSHKDGDCISCANDEATTSSAENDSREARNDNEKDYLQPCFMYLGHFLEDEEIDPEKLSHLWMIEGLLLTGQSARGERMMDMTERYLRELTLKGLVEVQEDEEIQGLPLCSRHSVHRPRAYHHTMKSPRISLR